MKGRQMKLITILLLAVAAVTAHANPSVIDQTGQVLGSFGKEKCGVNNYCHVVSGKLQRDPHYLNSISTSTTATAALCGVTFYVTADSKITLPVASTVPGCRYEIVNGMSTWSSGTYKNVIIAPGSESDHIRVLTTNAGAELRNSTFGSSVILEAVSSADEAWVPIGKEQGTWTDIN
jgi:hypothetical protein